MGLRQRIADLGQPRSSARALLLLPLVLIAAITAADILSPIQAHLGPLLVIAPTITASFAGPRWTATMGALAVAAQAFIGVHFGVLLTDTVIVQVIVLALLSALVVVFSLVREQGRRELLQVRTVSEAAQKALLGPFPTRIGPLRFAALYLAAEDEAQIGGDLYAVAPVDHAVRIIIGDVRGKGLQAIGESGFLLGAFRQASRQSLTLDILAAALDQSVAQYLSDLGGLVDSPDDIAEHFVTAMLLEIPDEGDMVRMTDCGHPPPLLISAGRLTPVAGSDPAPPLGLGAMGAGGQPLDTFRFGPGDMILLYTDGVVEARDHQGAFYPLAERVAQWVTHTPEVLLRHLREDLLAHAGGRLDDDAAVVAVQYAGAPEILRDTLRQDAATQNCRMHVVIDSAEEESGSTGGGA